jgi:hypothetical protein
LRVQCKLDSEKRDQPSKIPRLLKEIQTQQSSQQGKRSTRNSVSGRSSTETSTRGKPKKRLQKLASSNSGQTSEASAEVIEENILQPSNFLEKRGHIPGAFTSEHSSSWSSSLTEIPEDEELISEIDLSSILLDSETNNLQSQAIPELYSFLEKTLPQSAQTTQLYIPNTPKTPEKNTSQKTRKMSNRMPNPGAADAPSWDGGNPDLLREFLYKIKRLYKLCNIATDAEKIEWVLDYVSLEVRDDWSTWDEVITPSWDDFEKRLKEEYPETIEVEHGTMQRLRKLCQEYRGLAIDDMATFKQFKRKFVAEAKKLLVPPAIVTNRELVELFVSTLDKEFRDHLSVRLSYETNVAAAPAGQVRRSDDPHKYDNVLKVAEALVTSRSSNIGMTASKRGSKSDETTPAVVKKESSQLQKVSEEMHQMQAEIASIKDSITVTEKLVRSFVGATTGQRTTQNFGVSQGGYRPTMTTTDKCFYCGNNGHDWKTCPRKDQDVKAGKIKIADNWIKFMDGTDVPRGQGTISERIEKYLKPKEQHYYGVASQQSGIIEIPEALHKQLSVPQYMTYVQEQAADPRELELLELRSRMTAIESREKQMNRPNSSNAYVGQRDMKEDNEMVDKLASLQEQLAMLISQQQESQYVETRANQGTQQGF